MSQDILADLEGRDPKPGYPCFLAVLRVTDPELAQQAERGIASTHSAESVAAWLRDHGATVSGITISRHRRGICASCRTS